MLAQATVFDTDCTAHISHPEITKCVVGSLAVKSLMLSLKAVTASFLSESVVLAPVAG